VIAKLALFKVYGGNAPFDQDSQPWLSVRPAVSWAAVGWRGRYGYAVFPSTSLYQYRTSVSDIP
jgi:hypothetical protein